MSGELEVRKPMTFLGQKFQTGDRIARNTILDAVGASRLRAMERLGWLADAPVRRRSRKTVESPEEAQDGMEEGEAAAPPDGGTGL